MKDGGPAFPESYVGADAPHEGIGGGMTLRDYFAASALTGLLQVNTPTKSDDPHGLVAIAAYAIADAMLAERDRREVE